MTTQGARPLSLLAQKQEELLRTFINVKQYDKLLFFLESTLFNNAPTLNCPSPFVINCLFTLATLGEYNNAGLIRKNFEKPLSQQPVSVRAINILRRLVNIVKELDEDVKDEKSNFGGVKYDQEDIIHTQEQLIGSLKLIRSDKGRFLRPRSIQKAYKEKTAEELDEFDKKGSDSDSMMVNSTDWSPQKKLLERNFDRLKPSAAEDESESESEGEGSLDRKSYYILRNERFDIALQGDGFWNAVAWALQCSSTKDNLNLEAWNVWKPILELIFDIIEIDLDQFITRKTNNEDDENGEPALFKNTLIYQFHVRAGYYPIHKVAEHIFTNSKSGIKPIFVNELQKAKSVFLVKPIGESVHQEGEFSWGSMKFRKRLYHLTAKAIYHSDLEHATKQHRWSLRDLARNVTENLLKCSYSDFRLFFILEKEEIKEDWRLQLLLDIIFDFLVQINTFIFNLPDPTWIYDQNPDILEMFLTNVTYEKKYYDQNESGARKMVEDYSKLNLALYLLINLYTDCSGYIGHSKIKKKLIIEWSETGEAKRRKVLESVRVNDLDIDNDLFGLTKTIKLQYNL
ncbi:Non-structural maintenance of chromosome element 5 [Wickerhamomyces ciferrii]|uniref:Non-structural maintenance of chromosome element 5 n=1 Tax=Wickerhamomyces ciferrii (strain ATCC 14091 / BCRC 22168 / CBS 111 / JCM 3599 / NBRC 0793 / NRRL Y-1031 F-60-10) TaxID=1206466 RepID=K0K7N9_WICCF|nr:Non-structural maintenance of chromosome element 5 [Wickerhamomyces ciferrii]CCH40830.1 Non-structural maintenance of chromosome element 5 [Wickerhamomyces ciferrii]